MDDTAPRSLLGRVELTRRSVVMAAPHTTVAVVREQWIELADLVAEVTRRQLASGAVEGS